MILVYCAGLLEGHFYSNIVRTIQTRNFTTQINEKYLTCKVQNIRECAMTINKANG